jgi:hypothetical protein
LESLLPDYSEFLDPWILKNADNFESYGKLGSDVVIRSCRLVINANYKNINDDSQKWKEYWYIFGSNGYNYYQNPELETALRNSMLKYANVRKDAEGRLPEAINAWETTDIKPLITVDGGLITFSFIMDQANKSAFNVGGMYFEEDLTLNYFNNGLVRKPCWFPNKSRSFSAFSLQNCCFNKEVVQKLKFPNNSNKKVTCE